jgi:hypothetical protein
MRDKLQKTQTEISAAEKQTKKHNVTTVVITGREYHVPTNWF